MTSVFFKRDLSNCYRSSYTDKSDSYYDLLFVGAKTRWWQGVFFRACYYGRLPIVKLVINKLNDTTDAIFKADLHAGLHLSCEMGHLEIVKFLVVCGTDTRDMDLAVACENNNTAVIDYLYGRGLKCCDKCFNGFMDRMIMDRVKS